MKLVSVIRVFVREFLSCICKMPFDCAFCVARVKALIDANKHISHNQTHGNIL